MDKLWILFGGAFLGVLIGRSLPRKIKDYHNHDLLHLILKKLHTMGEKTDQALADLQAIKTQLGKIGGETTTLLEKITKLEEAAANADTPQSVLDAIAEVKAQAQVVDDQVPDQE